MSTDRIVSLFGPSGVGYVKEIQIRAAQTNSRPRKTALAIEYSHKFLENHPCGHIFWVHGGSMETIEMGFKNIAKTLDFPDYNAPSADIFSIVKSGLSRKLLSPWLLVLSDLNESRINNHSHQSPYHRHSVDFLNSLLQSTSGHILLTMQDMQIGYKISGLQNTIKVPPLELKDAHELLTKQLPQPADQGSLDDAAELVLAIGALPYRIIRAAAYITTRPVTLYRYLQYFRKDTDVKELISDDLFMDPSMHQQDGVAAKMQTKVTYDFIQREQPDAMRLLCLMAMLDTQSIPVDLLQKNYNSNVAFDKDMGLLKALSLVVADVSETHISMNQYEKISVTIWLDQEESLEEWQEVALDTLRQFCPETGERDKWNCWDRIYPHVQMVIGYNLRQLKGQLQKAELLRLASTFNLQRGRGYIAETQILESIAIKQSLNSSYDHYINDLEDLASILGYQNRLRDSETILRKVLCLYYNRLGPEHENTLNCLNNLAAKLICQGRYSEGEEILHKLLETGSNTAEKRLRDLEVKHNLGFSAFSQNDLPKAEQILKELLDSKDNSFDIEPQKIPATARLLGKIKIQQGNYADGEVLLRKAWKLYEKALGETNIRTLEAMDLLAYVLHMQNRFGESSDLLETVVERKKRTFGILDQGTLESINSLEALLLSHFKYDEAENSITKTLHLRENFLGEYHPQTMRSRVNLAFALCGQHRKHEAIALLQSVLQYRELTLGPEDDLVLDTKRKLSIMSEYFCDIEVFSVSFGPGQPSDITIYLGSPATVSTD